jgi:non-specific serine/threonine protein kinase
MMAILKDEAPVALRHEGTRVFENRGWEVDLTKRELRANGSAVPIGSRAFEIIEALVLSAGALVTKEDLTRRVWPGLIVEDNTVQVHVSAIRKALGPDRSILKTVSGRGYRLLGDWEIRQELSTPTGVERGRSASYPFLTNVPVAASALIGRENAVEQLCDLVSAYRLVTLTGPGGIGKTVLASEVARRLFPTSESDVFFVELVSLSDPKLVPSTIADTLNLQLQSDAISPESVARTIGGRRLLLVLDNCEHVVDAAAAMAETLVRFCPHTTILATSRETLRIDGEFAYRVAALEVPAQHVDGSDNVLEHSAVQLFIARTRSLRTDLGPQSEMLPVIAAICRKLDGMPLAIEFAAARAATLGIEQVAEHLDDRFALLTGGRRTALPRHQTLRATLDWSYELLPEAEQRLLRHLSVFPAGFTLAAAAAVVSSNESSVATGISSLVSKSLVTMDGSEAASRWRLLETVRVYGLEKLVLDNEENETAMRRVVEFYVALFAPFAIERQLQTAIDDLGRYRREIDNLRAGLNWAFSRGGDTALGFELAATVGDFWIAASMVAECCEWAEKALSKIDPAIDTRWEMVLQCSFGIALIYTQGMTPHARAVLVQALALARRLEDFHYQLRATCGLWFHSARSMALTDAFAFAREYDEVAQERDIHSRATAAWLVGVPQTYLGDHTQASERLKWAIDNYPVEARRRDMIRLGGDPRASSQAHRTVNLLSQGFLDEASRESRLAVDEARSAGQPTALCASLAWAAGFISLSLGELESANNYGEELIDIAYKHGLRPFHAAGLCVRGTLAVRRGDAGVGIGLLRSGLAEMQAARYLLFHPFFRTELAAALGTIGLFDEGVAEINETLRFAVETDYRWFVPEILRTEGELLALRGSEEPGLIEALFRRSMNQASTQNALYWELSAATSLAAFLRNQHRHGEALAVLSPLYDHFADGLSTPRLREAGHLLHQLRGKNGSESLRD